MGILNCKNDQIVVFNPSYSNGLILTLTACSKAKTPLGAFETRADAPTSALAVMSMVDMFNLGSAGLRNMDKSNADTKDSVTKTMHML